MNRALIVLSLLALAGCGGASASARARARASAGERSRTLATTGPTQATDGRCSSEAPDRELSEYDTSGDDIPDVRKVFLRVGRPPAVRTILICREADLNGDGRKDVVRYYNDEGRPLREEADRDFDGQMDEVTHFEDGRVARQEFDTNGNGVIDMKIFMENSRPVRSERDLLNRSTTSTWHADRWEYYENGRVVRMGTDVDGDGRVDRWDRFGATEAAAAAEDPSGDEDSAPADGEAPADSDAGTS